MSSLMEDITAKKLREWDFVDCGRSEQHSPGNERRVTSVIGPEGSHRGFLNISIYEADAIKSSFAAAPQEQSAPLDRGERFYKWRGPKGGWIFDDKPPSWPHQVVDVYVRAKSNGE